MNNLKLFTDYDVFSANELVKAYFHDETYNPTPLHTHNFCELNLVISGDGKHILDTSTFYIACGDLFMMPPHIYHGYTFNSHKYSIFHMLFHKQFFKKYEAELSQITNYHILFNIEPQIRTQLKNTSPLLHIDINANNNHNLISVLRELAALDNDTNHNSMLQKEYLTLYVIAKICSLAEEKTSSCNIDKRYVFDLMKSVEYIHSNFGAKLELQSLYKTACMSRSTYLRHFKQMLGCTPLEYIQDYRLRQAKSILKHSNKSITDIANECGFCDNAHFSRLFKEKYQLSPSKYRTLLKN